MSASTAANHKRSLLKILWEIAEAQGITITTFSQGWIVRLEKAGRVRHIYGYCFGLNTATSQLIADDKSAVSDLLQFNHIPTVEHQLFLQPRLANYISSQGSWEKIIAYAQSQNFQIVCKPNDGTGGKDVIRVRTPLELERAVHQLFETYRAICLSPFYKIEQEYRVIVLAGQCEVIYAKQRPKIIGDGQATVADLIAAQVNSGTLPASIAASAVELNQHRLHTTLAKDETLSLDWRHNLGHGSYPVFVEDQPTLNRLENLALTCAAALNITFASIDIIDTTDQWLILEVNPGIMMENFVHLAPDGYAIAKTIYARAIDLMFK